MAKTILIIEDEASIQNIVRAFLEDAGYTVYAAGDGLEGIEIFRRCNPDLVLLDLMLPKIDGFAVCEILRKESRTPIIMLTARDDDASQMKGFDVLADDYIIKPFSMPLVLRRIEAVLRRTVFAEILNQCLKVAKGKALIRLSEGKVRAIHSAEKNGYQVFPSRRMRKDTCRHRSS